MASPCRLCPNECGVNRLAGETGRCGIGAEPRVASFGPHFGEEPPLVGTHGSGTVFFSGCNLACVFCQNWEISQRRKGEDLSIHTLARIFLHLQSAECHNLNLVTPTHQAHSIVAALVEAVEGGFNLPVVWNCGGYESVETLQLLDGLVDIYMPDLKYGDNAAARRFSGVRGYVRASQAAVREMHRQVGDLIVDEQGFALRGLIVRHLILPSDVAGTEPVLRFLAQEISPNAYLNLMDQYRPMHRAHEFQEIARPISTAEFVRARNLAIRAGLHRFAP